ncbi:sigma-70 family RNA polymerase sigma factor [Polymorphobacter sp. PAMC 29334]|uniref:sigma-70 family RNA polymerase sigma factor n=1 Tax=Polymorphobacter sp. PAMC 29334 TaxID=2862331 RepID=UPI001D01D011|nr:sigma-70 family RNA polymerase sigma factor [Polymorphobacter sp. PAMC 29334]
MADDWAPLMAASQAGDTVVDRRLLDELRRWLKRYYRRRLPSSMLDDAVQDALVAIHTKRHTYDPSKPFSPWLAAIARYKWIDRLRSMRTHHTEMLPEEHALPEAMVVGDAATSILSAVVLRDLIATLKPAQAAVIRLVKLQGFSIEEAATVTGQSTALVKVNIHRGLGRLSEKVKGYAGDHDD